jgi:lipoprotein-releasing system permease protein
VKSTDFIALKYFFSKKNYSIVYIISIFSVLVLSIANFSFLTILSVFSGLEEYSLSFSKSFDPDIKLKSGVGNKLEITENDIQLIREVEGVVNISKTILGKAVIQNGNKTEFAEILGVDDEFNNVILIDSIMEVGSFSKLDNYTSFTSSSISQKLDLTLYSASGQYFVNTLSDDYVNFFIQPFNSSETLISNGIFRTRNENKVIVSLPVASKLFGFEKNNYSELLIKTSGELNATKEKIKRLFPKLSVLTHKEQNETLFKIMQSERLVIIAIMFFIVLVSAFNVIATVSMLIIEKEANIKTLKALGMNTKEIFQLFFKHGLLINLTGLLIGLFLSIILIYLQINFSIISIPGIDVPYPVSLKASNMIVLMVSAFFISVFSSYLGALASRKIS